MSGLSIQAEDRLPSGVASIAMAVWAGKTNRVALAIGVGTLGLLLLLKRIGRLPGVVLAVGGATLVVVLLDLPTRAASHSPFVIGLERHPKGTGSSPVRLFRHRTLVVVDGSVTGSVLVILSRT
jgi:hypothetical protein